MKKFRGYIEKWLNGEKVKGFNMASYDIEECVFVYNALARKEKPCFINEKVKAVLDACGIETEIHGIGWIVK